MNEPAIGFICEVEPASCCGQPLQRIRSIHHPRSIGHPVGDLRAAHDHFPFHPSTQEAPVTLSLRSSLLRIMNEAVGPRINSRSKHSTIRAANLPAHRGSSFVQWPAIIT